MTASFARAYATGSALPRILVREDSPRYPAYESEGSERRSLGSVAVTAGARWIATLTVPVGREHVAFVELERRGDLPLGYRGSEERAAFSFPSGEADAVVNLLAGLVAQGRADGVLAD